MFRSLVITTLVLIALVVLPASSVAQPPVCKFYGSATIEGQSVQNGTLIKAWIDGKVVTTTTTSPFTVGSYSYDYEITVEEEGSAQYTGKTIIFTVGSDDLQAGTAIWAAGDNEKLNLDGKEDTSLQELPDPSITLTPTEGLVTRISGEGFSPGSTITVTIGGTWAGETQASTDSAFAIVVTAPNQEAGTYDVSVSDAGGTTQQATLTVPDLQGEPGIDGEPGVAGSTGPKGDSGGTTFAVVAMVLSVIAVAIAGFVAIKFMDFLKKQNA